MSGTLAIHVLLGVAGDALVMTHPLIIAPLPPRIELVDVEVPAVVKPPPRPVEQPKVLETQRKPATAEVVRPVRAAAPPVDPPPFAAADPGGAPVVSIENLA